MTRARRQSKPLTPEQIARRLAEERAAQRNPETWGADATALKRQPDVTVVLDARRRVQTAHRADVFHRLHARAALSNAQLDAIRRLETDMAERRGEGDKPQPGAVVDCSGHSGDATDRQIAAGERIDGARIGVLRRVGLRDAVLLRELLEPRRVPELTESRWRIVVGLVAGETRAEAQAAVIRSAAENLVLAYREVDQGR